VSTQEEHPVVVASDEYSARLHDEEAATEAEEAIEGRPYELIAARRGVMSELIQDKAGFAGLAFLILLVVVAAFAPWIAPYSPTDGNLSNANLPPFWSDGGTTAHWLGTDSQGYDVLSRLIYGARTSLLIGAAVVVLAGTFGVVYGLIAGYKGGKADRWLMGWVDLQVAFPGLLLAIVILSLVGGSVTTVIVVLALNGWMVYARMTRGIVLTVKETPYVEAAEMVGCRSRRVIFKHILPNLTSALATLGVLELARIILAEAALSFLGLGIQFPQVSWGLDTARGGDYIFSNAWLVIFPGLALSITVLAVNLVASWLRVVFDPQEREKRFAATATSGGGAMKGASA
jgi:ABC-type dipeptide/oligopeptide/nickel transport system permease subunit